MSIPLPIMPALNLFSEIIIAYDVTASYDANGKIEYNTSADYNIGGVIQPIDDKKSILEYEGKISEGMFMLHTLNKLYFTDINNKDIEENKQTFIRYENEIYELWGVKTWNTKSGGINKYIMVKYTNSEDNP